MPQEQLGGLVILSHFCVDTGSRSSCQTAGSSHMSSVTHNPAYDTFTITEERR